MQVYLLNAGLDPAELSDLEARIRIGVPNLHRIDALEALRVDRLRSDVEEEKPCVLYPVSASGEKAAPSPKVPAHERPRSADSVCQRLVTSYSAHHGTSFVSR